MPPPPLRNLNLSLVEFLSLQCCWNLVVLEELEDHTVDSVEVRDLKWKDASLRMSRESKIDCPSVAGIVGNIDGRSTSDPTWFLGVLLLPMRSECQELQQPESNQFIRKPKWRVCQVK